MNTQLQLDFDSEDAEGSDISFESSFDEQLEQEFENVLQQKQIVQFKDQMERMIQLNPEIGNFDLPKPEEEERKPRLPRKSASRSHVQISPRSETKSAKVLPHWNQLSKTILNNAKKVGMMPTLEEFQMRLNLFRAKNEKSDVVDLIIQEQNRIQRDIQQQEKKNKAIENAVHESIEAKVRKETGDVGYVSYRKKIQFQFRIRKAEELAQQKVEKQQRKKDADMGRSLAIFHQLFRDRNMDEEADQKSKAAEDLYKRVSKCNDDIDVKQTILRFIIDHRKKQIEEYKQKPTLLKPSKFISEECREFSLLQPNMQMKQMMGQQQLKKEMLEKRDDLEGESIYLLTKVNQILDGNLMKMWKTNQGSKV